MSLEEEIEGLISSETPAFGGCLPGRPYYGFRPSPTEPGEYGPEQEPCLPDTPEYGPGQPEGEREYPTSGYRDPRYPGCMI